MRVGHVKAVHHGLVAAHRILGDGVDDLLALRTILVQIGEGPAPAVRLGNDLAAYAHAVRLQMDGDVLRTDAVRVVTVVPGLRTGNHDLLRLHMLRRMGIGNVESVYNSLVIRNRVLRNGVGDGIALGVLLREGAEAVSPASVRIGAPCVHRLAAHKGAVRSQNNGDLLRTDSVRVVSVVPGLHARNLNHFGRRNLRRMRVGHGKSAPHVSGDLRLVILDGDLLDRIGDGAAALRKHRKIGKRVGPGIAVFFCCVLR